MPGSNIIPTLRVQDAPAAIDWLCDVLGFHRHAVYTGSDNTIAHAELTLGGGMIMLGSASSANPFGRNIVQPDGIDNRVTSPMYVVVPDCGPVYERAKAAGAEFLAEMRTMDYGGQAFTVRGPEGFIWSLGEYDPWAAREAGSGNDA